MNINGLTVRFLSKAQNCCPQLQKYPRTVWVANQRIPGCRFQVSQLCFGWSLSPNPNTIPTNHNSTTLTSPFHSLLYLFLFHRSLSLNSITTKRKSYLCSLFTAFTLSPPLLYVPSFTPYSNKSRSSSALQLISLFFIYSPELGLFLFSWVRISF